MVTRTNYFFSFFFFFHFFKFTKLFDLVNCWSVMIIAFFLCVCWYYYILLFWFLFVVVSVAFVLFFFFFFKDHLCSRSSSIVSYERESLSSKKLSLDPFNSMIVETPHPYFTNTVHRQTSSIPGATHLCLQFDGRCSTERE